MTTSPLFFGILTLLFVMVFWIAMHYLGQWFPSRILTRLNTFLKPHSHFSPFPRFLEIPFFSGLLRPRLKSFLSVLHSFFLHYVDAPRRRQRILADLPNALDLWCICMEAGLTFEAALSRIAREMNHQGNDLGQELHYLSLSLNAGLSKEAALRQFAIRVGGDQVHAVVSLLIQAERFGTSVVHSLHAHADMLREQRRQLAQEHASKIGLKLLLPLVLCHLPALFMVLLGPACIQLYRTLSPLWSAQGYSFFGTAFA